MRDSLIDILDIFICPQLYRCSFVSEKKSDYEITFSIFTPLEVKFWKIHRPPPIRHW